MSSILKVTNISKAFTIDSKKIDVLKNISIEIKEGEFVAINGSSGSGKSTFLSIIAGLDKPTSGEVFLLDNNITKFSEEDLAEIRNQKIGFVFQSFYLIPSLSAFENVYFPSEISKKNDLKFAEELLKRVGL